MLTASPGITFSQADAGRLAQVVLADAQRAHLARLRARYLSWSGRAMDAERLCRQQLAAHPEPDDERAR